MDSSVFLEQSEVIERLVDLNRHLISLLAQHTDVSKEERRLASIIEENPHLTVQARAGAD